MAPNSEKRVGFFVKNNSQYGLIEKNTRKPTKIYDEYKGCGGWESKNKK
jgi:hypothetical protein